MNWFFNPGNEFETRSLAATRRGFAFHVADPVSSIHKFTLNDLTTNSVYAVAKN
jgi:hypothetical protein